MRTPTPDFTLDELLADLAGGDEGLDGYRTLREWCEDLHVGRGKMLDVLRLAKRQGKLLLGREQRETIDGRMSPQVVYGFETKREDSNVVPFRAVA